MLNAYPPLPEYQYMVSGNQVYGLDRLNPIFHSYGGWCPVSIWVYGPPHMTAVRRHFISSRTASFVA